MNTHDDIPEILKIACKLHSSLVKRAMKHGFNSWGPRYQLALRASKNGETTISYTLDIPRAQTLNAHEKLSLADLEVRTRKRLSRLATLIRKIPCFEADDFHLELIDTPVDTTGPSPGLQISVNNTTWPMADGDLDAKRLRLDAFLRQITTIPVDGPLRRFRVNAADRTRPGVTIQASSARSALLTYAAYLKPDLLEDCPDAANIPEVAEIIDPAYLLEVLGDRKAA